ncbi:MAG: VanZ family protein [Lachnospiraceae bacterium]|nr:VanZ family protein [Lachnospiraceae bacterium]
MNKQTSTRTRNIIRILIIITIGIAWVHSALPPSASDMESGFFFDLLKPILGIFLPPELVTPLLVRKMAHFTEYAFLGGEMIAYVNACRRFEWKHILNALFSGLAVAVMDETIQIFSGRGPAITDVWIDMAGFVTGGLIASIITLIKVRITNKNGVDEDIS